MISSSSVIGPLVSGTSKFDNKVSLLLPDKSIAVNEIPMLYSSSYSEKLKL